VSGRARGFTPFEAENRVKAEVEREEEEAPLNGMVGTGERQRVPRSRHLRPA